MTRSALVSRRAFLRTTAVAAAGGTLLSRAPAALGQQVRELNVWHTEVEAQTVKTIQDTSIAEFERKFPRLQGEAASPGLGGSEHETARLTGRRQPAGSHASQS